MIVGSMYVLCFSQYQPFLQRFTFVHSILPLSDSIFLFLATNRFCLSMFLFTGSLFSYISIIFRFPCNIWSKELLCLFIAAIYFSVTSLLLAIKYYNIPIPASNWFFIWNNCSYCLFVFIFTIDFSIKFISAAGIRIYFSVVSHKFFWVFDEEK